MFRITKRDKSSISDSLIFRSFGFAVGIILSMLLILLLGYNPIASIAALFDGAFGSLGGLRNTIKFAIPLATTALGLSIAFRMKFWNIGGEGQLLMGGTAAMFVSLIAGPNIPGWILIPSMLIAGIIGGAFWALIPGIFRIQLRTNETLFTLMMNYVALYLVKYLYHDLWRDRDPAKFNFPGIKMIQQQAVLPNVFGISVGIIVPLILAFLVYILIKRTKPGYEIRVVGESEPTANYAGMNVKRIMLGGVLLSGGIIGLAGAVKLAGETMTLSDNLTGGAGFTAIVIAWLANLSAPFILVVSFLVAGLEQGAQTMQLRLGVPAAVADIVKGLILMSFLGSEFFLRYRLVMTSVIGKNKRLHSQMKNHCDDPNVSDVSATRSAESDLTDDCAVRDEKAEVR